jgi:hypothetical protein
MHNFSVDESFESNRHLVRKDREEKAKKNEVFVLVRRELKV